MRPMFVLPANGPIYTAHSTPEATPSISCSPQRDRLAAKHFLQTVLWRIGNLRPRVVNVDGRPAYPSVIAELKSAGELSPPCRCRVSVYMNNVIEQDHRFIKKRVVASQESVQCKAHSPRSRATKQCT